MPLALVPPGRRGNKFWYVRGTINGQRIEASTHATDQRAAQAFANRLIAETLNLSTAAPAGDIRFDEVCKAYIDARAPSKSEVWRLARVMAHFGPRRIADITPASIAQFARSVYPGAQQAASRNRNILTVTSTILHFAADQGWVKWLRLKREKEVKPIMPSPSVEEMQTLINTAEGDMKFLLTWLMCTGMRISHVLSIDWSRIDLRKGVFQFFDSKGKQWLTLPIHDSMMPYLEKIPAAARRGRVFQWRYRWAIYPKLDELHRKTGIKFRPHGARRALARTLEQAGVPTHTTQEAGGWKDSRSVSRYIGQDVERIREATRNIKIAS